MGKASRAKGGRGERAFAKISGGVRTWWSASPAHPDDAHDVIAHGRPWEVKFFKQGFSPVYNALEEFVEHDATGEATPIVALKQNGKPWLVAMYYDDWKKENE